MDVEAYLERIGVKRENITLDGAGLALLQRQHLLNIPFENLDIHWKRPIVLDTERFFRKIVEGGRGGFCYELNGLFSELLNSIGFKAHLVSARVSTGGGSFSPEYSHAAIIAEAEGGGQFLVDVGFGAFTAGPLKMVLDAEQEDATGTYVIRERTDLYLQVMKKEDDEWKAEYTFVPLLQNLSKFAGMCDFHQTSPESHFTRGKVCSLMTAGGRKTLTDKQFIVTGGEDRSERDVGSEEEFGEILEREFGILMKV